jgi:succinoglycan biosynthesis protein ExoA
MRGGIKMSLPTLVAGPEVPFVSMILPIRNEASYIEKTLRAMLRQDYSRLHLEIIVADGDSSDGTVEVVKAAAAASDIPIKVVRNPERIVPTGFNRAVEQSQGDVIVRIDGHTIIAPDYIRQCVDALRRSGAANVGGRMDPVGITTIGKAVALATASPFGVGGSRFHYSRTEEWVDTVYMGAWPREVFAAAGLFDTEQVRNQDDEFNYRLRSMGGRILLSPAIQSLYHNRGTVRSLWRQYFQYGYWKVRVMQKHAKQMRLSHFVPAAFVLMLTTMALVGLWLPTAAWLAIGISASYLIANLAASFLASRKQLSLFPHVALVFGILHFAYGAGFLSGLARFANRWRTVPLPPVARFEGKH